jgi:hypothetical protein
MTFCRETTIEVAAGNRYPGHAFRRPLKERDAMDEPSDEIVRKNPNERREETDRAFAAIMEEERRSRLAKSMRLRSIRLMQNGDTA